MQTQTEIAAWCWVEATLRSVKKHTNTPVKIEMHKILLIVLGIIETCHRSILCVCICFCLVHHSDNGKQKQSEMKIGELFLFLLLVDICNVVMIMEQNSTRE